MLIDVRTGSEIECTPEEQAGGEHAGECERCKRKTVHCVLGRCINPNCEISEWNGGDE